jgi:HlyD family secretion protein
MAQLITRPPSTNGHGATVPPPSPPRPKPRFQRPPLWTIVAACVAIVGLIAGGAWRVRSAEGGGLVTSPVTQGSLAQTATSSGTVNPQNTISVGTEVSGTISQIFVDFNSQVKAGQILAKLDPTTLQAALDQAKAALAQSEAQASAAGSTAQGQTAGISVSQASAAAQLATQQADQAAITTAVTNVTKSQAALKLAQQTLSRDQTLLAQGFIAPATVDTDTSNEVAAQSTLDSAQASLSQARSQAAAAAAQTRAANAGVLQSVSTASSSAQTEQADEAAVLAAQAQVQQAQLNLDHTVIKSPVNGTVIAREVSVGQTVAASLQTPTLFSIAQDLGKMEVDLAVGENDIGNVKVGDPVDFSVLAYPDQTFHGTVAQVRVNPTTTNNVVTYDTVVLVDNRDGKLLPGMTANATIQVAQDPNALIVPLAALSYHPANANAQHRQRPQAAKPSTNGSPWGQTLTGGSGSLVAGSRARVFVDNNGKLTPVPVQIALVNGTSAAVTPIKGTLQAGEQVVVADGSSQHHAASQSAPGGPGGLTRGLH